MKRLSTKTTSALGAILMLAAACTQELDDNPAGNSHAISFQKPQTDTRAAVIGTTLPNDFRVWAWYGETTGNTGKNVFDGKEIHAPGWTYDGGAQYWIPGMMYNFYGVYPVLPTEGDGTTVAVTNEGVITVDNFDCSTTGTEAIDLMTAKRQGLSGDDAPVVQMTFGHELAKVNFTVESESAVTITKCKIYGVGYRGKLEKDNRNSTTAWTVLATNNQADGIFDAPSFSLNAADGLSRDVFGDMLLLPHNEEQLENVLLDFTYQYEGETTGHASTVKLKTTAVNRWDTGKSYHYKITIQDAKLQLNVTVLDWDEEDTSVKW